MKKYAIILGCLLLNGCAFGWHNKYYTYPDVDKDKFECEQIAAGNYPTHIAQYQGSNGYVTQGQTSCVGNYSAYSCTSQPGQYVPPTQTSYDANAFNRVGLYNSCMRSRGYEFKMGFD